MDGIENDVGSGGTHMDGAMELRLDADLTQLPVIRSMVGSVAARADFDVDTIADLRLAVDEACSTLINAACTGGKLVCRFTIADDMLRFDGSVPVESPEPPSTGTFGWQVLTTLTDSATSWVDSATVEAGPWLHVELTKLNPLSSDSVSGV